MSSETGEYLPEHTGYFSRDGWAARCLRQHVRALKGEEPGEEFSPREILRCLEFWLEFGEKTHGNETFETCVDRMEYAAREGLKIVAIARRLTVRRAAASESVQPPSEADRRPV